MSEPDFVKVVEGFLSDFWKAVVIGTDKID